MKKSVSLLLALLLCLAGLFPATAEESGAPAAFAFTLADFRGWHNTLIAQAGMDVEPVWTISEDGTMASADARELGRLTLSMNAAGMVTSLNVETALTAEDMQTGAYYFGGSAGLFVVALMAAEDPACLSDAAGMAQMEAELSELISALFARMGEVAEGGIAQAGRIAGHTATIYAAYDASGMALRLGITFVP